MAQLDLREVAEIVKNDTNYNVYLTRINASNPHS